MDQVEGIENSVCGCFSRSTDPWTLFLWYSTDLGITTVEIFIRKEFSGNQRKALGRDQSAVLLYTYILEVNPGC